MREIKTVALIGLGAIGSFLASNLQRVLGENLRIVAGGARKERLERDGIVVIFSISRGPAPLQALFLSIVH